MRKNTRYLLDIGAAGLLRRLHLPAMAVSIICLTGVAWADMDYKCLNDCVSGGETTSVCMPKCSYDTNSKTSNDGRKKNPYNQFSGMEAPEVVKKQEEAERAKQPVNYNCMPDCLKNNMQYKFCEEKCREENPGIIQYNSIPDPVKKPL